MDLENIILGEVSQSQKNTHGMYVLTDTWMLGKKHEIPRIQLVDYMKLKRNEDQTVDASVLLRRRNNTIKGSRG
jgi:hypothetical protein